MVSYRPKQGSNAGAFTLVELLVVIGIVALLIAILLPSLAKARKAAQQTQCASNLHQIGLANQIYAQTTGYYPGCQAFLSGTAGSNAPRVAVWAGCLKAYMNNQTGAFYCPSEENDLRWTVITSGNYYFASAADAGYGYKQGEAVLATTITAGKTVRDLSYGWNDWGITGSYVPGQDCPGEANSGVGLGLGGDIDETAGEVNGGRVRSGHIRQPAEFIVVTDRARYTPLGAPYPYRYNVDPSNPSEKPGAIHQGGSNVLFADGHVTWMSFNDLVDIYPPGYATYGGANMYVSSLGAAPGGSGPNAIYIRRLWNRDYDPH